MKNFSFSVFLWLLSITPLAWGADAQSALVNCDQIKQSAQNAQLQYIHAYTPSVNPVQTFDDAVGHCLENIQKFNLSLTLPSLGDLEQLLSDMAQKLAQSACQSATSQFNNAVNAATQAINGAASNASGGMVNNSMAVGTQGTGITISGDNGAAVRNTVTNSTNRVVNTLQP